METETNKESVAKLKQKIKELQKEIKQLKDFIGGM